jgi:sugar transferase (PEP-CTERM system associated)
MPSTPTIDEGLDGLATARPLERAPPLAAMRGVVAAVDGLLVALSFLIATAIRIPESVNIDMLPRQVAVVTVLMVLGLAREGNYELQIVRDAQQVLRRLGLGATVGLGLVVAGSFVWPEIAVGRGVFALLAGIAVPLLFLWRHFLLRTIRESALRPRAVVLGEPGLARTISRALSSARFGGAEVVGILAPEPAPEADAGPEGPRVLGTYADLGEVVARYGVAQAIVVAGAREERLPIDDIIALRRQGISFEEGAAVYEALTGKILAEKLTPGWLIFARAFEVSSFERAVRRAVAVAIAGTALIVLAPFFALVAILVKLDSRGPVLFRQARVGEGGRVFELLKFRTMREDAEAATGAVWAAEDDPRATRVGRVLRRTRIDELPQLWNVLRGDMYFVGPRPERPEFVATLRRSIPHYDERHKVKPGITGWAQINYRYGASVADAAEKLLYDLYYIQNRSLLLDLDIILGTIRVMAGASNKN